MKSPNEIKDLNLFDRPSNWGGYSFKPYYFEFWEGHKSRLNKRNVYGEQLADICVNSQKNLKGLEDYLNSLNLKFKLDFLYSVYEDKEINSHMIFYHGKFSGNGNNTTVTFDINEIPYEKIITNAEKTMMKRYQDENHHGQFGIYQGNEKKGKVKKVF